MTFYNPANPAARETAQLGREAARQLGLQLVERHVRSAEELRLGLKALKPRDADAFFQISDGMVTSQAHLVIDAAKAKRMPTMFSHDTGLVVKGGLASYGQNFHRVRSHLGKACPADPGGGLSEGHPGRELRQDRVHHQSPHRPGDRARRSRRSSASSADKGHRVTALPHSPPHESVLAAAWVLWQGSVTTMCPDVPVTHEWRSRKPLRGGDPCVTTSPSGSWPPATPSASSTRPTPPRRPGGAPPGPLGLRRHLPGLRARPGRAGTRSRTWSGPPS